MNCSESVYRFRAAPRMDSYHHISIYAIIFNVNTNFMPKIAKNTRPTRRCCTISGPGLFSRGRNKANLHKTIQE
jgi:hypothetical protein